MSSLWHDLRFALRMLAKAPGHTAVLVITLALGIGASTTIFSVVRSVLLQPLPYPQPDRLVRVYTEFPTMDLKKFWVSTPEYFDLARGCTTCESVAALQRGTASFAGGDRPVRVEAGYTTQNFLPTIGVQPQLGRVWTADEDVPNALPTVVVLSHGVWQRAFGGDPDVIGKKVTLDAIPVTVIGVMPEGFEFPERIEAWAPAGYDPANQRRGGHGSEVYVRLKPDATIGALRAELAGLTAQWSAGKDTNQQGVHTIRAEDHPMLAFPLHGEIVGSLATTLWLLQGAVLCVLLIAIANVTNLLLARAEARTREIAVRHAIGATRGRLVRQLITESVVLGLLGGGLGVLVAVWALDATLAVLPRSAPRLAEISLDGGALMFALIVTLVSSLLFGLAPILHTRRADLHGSLKEGGPRTTGSKTRLRVRRALVTAEIALAVVLVIGCGMMVKSFLRLQEIDLGFQPDGVLTFEVEIPQATYDTPDKVEAFWRRLDERMDRIPGVEGSSLITGVPTQRRLNANDLDLPGRTPVPGVPWNTDYWTSVGPDVFDVLGARIVRGRALTASDTATSPAVVVVNQAFADKYFPGEDPIGQVIDIDPDPPDLDPKPPYQTVVGVVANIKQAAIDRPAGTEVFYAFDQTALITAGGLNIIATVILRTHGDPDDLAPAAGRALAEVDPTLPMSKLRTLDHVVWEAVARPRFLTFLLGAFAVVALVLAGVGIYGVMAYTVAQRTHEIGIRVALGAQPGQVRNMVLRQGAVLVGTGVVLGLVAAVGLELWLDRTLAAVLYGERLRDPLLFGGVVAVVATTALVASLLPARRATRIAPTVALRAE